MHRQLLDDLICQCAEIEVLQLHLMLTTCHVDNSHLGHVAGLPEHGGAVGEAEPVGRRRREALQDARVEFVLSRIGGRCPQGHSVTTPGKSSKLPNYQCAHNGAITKLIT